MNLSKSLETNLSVIKDKLMSDDISFLHIEIGKAPAILAFANELISKENVGELIMRPASNFQGELTEKALFDLFFSPEKKTVYTTDDVITEILSGNAVIFADLIPVAVSFGFKQFEKRAITEPPTSTVIKGPR